MTDAKRWFIADHAISDETEDQFAHNDVATQLADIVQSIEAPAAIGLLGGFGTGKSSIINLLQNQLKGHERFQVVALSAEKHTNVERQRAIVHSFAEALHDDAGIERKLIDPLLERTQTEIVEAGVILERTPIGDFAAKHRKAIGMAALKGAGIVLALYLLAAGVLALVDGLGWADTRPFVDPISTMVPLLVVVATLLGLGTAVPAWVKAALTPPSRTSKKPRIEAADEFERLFGDLADLCKKQLVIVVDDIDRLSPDQVLEALASVKTFQSIPRKPTIFILTCDERVIRQALASARPGLSEVNDSVEEAAEEYLNKLFVVRQPLPPHLGQDMTSFASAAMSRANHAGIDALGPNLQRVIDILVHDGVRDPRHVIRLLNAFFADYRMASVRENAGRLQLGEVTSRPALLARLTVLRSDFADFYERVTVEFPLLTAVDRLLLGETLDNEEEEIIRIAFANRIKPEEPVTGNIVPSDLRAFLRRTVQHVERDRPLHAFIYLGQTPAGRVLGSERSEQIRRSLENGDDTQLRARLAEGAEVAVAAVTHTIDSLKHARPGLPLENAVHAASGALDDAPDGARIELANELADVIDREESTTPSPDRLARVIRSAAHDYQQGLLARVADFAGDDDAALRAERAHVLVDLAVEDAKRAPLVGALSTYFTSLHADADWNVIPGWIETAAAIPVAATRSRASPSC